MPENVQGELRAILKYQNSINESLRGKMPENVQAELNELRAILEYRNSINESLTHITMTRKLFLELLKILDNYSNV